MTVRNQMVLQRKINYRIKCRKGKWIRCLSISLSFRLPQTTYPISPAFVNIFMRFKADTCSSGS